MINEATDGRVSDRVRLLNFDRFLLVWLHRLYPSLLDANVIVQRGGNPSVGADAVSAPLALEVPPRRRPPTG
jgi:hypothetical protein